MTYEEQEDAVAVCTDCGNILPDSKAYNNSFLQEGFAASCNMCGGVIVVSMRADVERTIKKSKQNRGL